MNRWRVIGIAVAVCIALGAVAYLYWPQIIDAQQSTMMTFDPSAQRAFDYGEMHFDAKYPNEYNIARAQYFFTEAEALDPSLPYVFHELARIQFLKGNFHAALALINIQIAKEGDTTPTSYYVRGLIEGYMGQYDAAAADYAHFLDFQPHNWAAKNDEAWVLLKAGHYQEAFEITESGLTDYPQNAWLLNSNATALYELGDYQQALVTLEYASAAASNLTPSQWAIAYPGNDPAIAPEGLQALQGSIADNMHMVTVALASSTVQSK